MRENNKYNMYNKYNQVGCDEVGYRDILKLYLLYRLYMLFFKNNVVVLRKDKIL